MIISRETLSVWMLSTALVLTYAVPATIYSVLFFLVVLGFLLTKYKEIDTKTFKVLNPIFWMALLGLIYGLENETTDIIRDIWHLVKALSCVMLGYYLARHSYRIQRLFNYFIIVSVILSILYMAPFVIGLRQIGLHHAADAAKISLVTAIALPLLLSRNNGLVQTWPSYVRYILAVIILLAFIFSLSRTAIGCLLIFLFAGKGIFDKPKMLLRYGLIAVLIVVIVSPQLPSTDSGNITFASKIGNSLAEIAFTDDSDPTAMVINWRGFEAYRAYIEFTNSTLLKQLVGRGLGATVDLGAPIQMGEEMNYQFIPVLHNGYMHALAKYGAFGVFFYLLFLIRVGRTYITYKSGVSQTTTSRILIGLSIVLAYTTLVISGIFNTENLDSILIMLGVFLSVAERLGHKSNVIN